MGSIFPSRETIFAQPIRELGCYCVILLFYVFSRKFDFRILSSIYHFAVNMTEKVKTNSTTLIIITFKYMFPPISRVFMASPYVPMLHVSLWKNFVIEMISDFQISTKASWTFVILTYVYIPNPFIHNYSITTRKCSSWVSKQNWYSNKRTYQVNAMRRVLMVIVLVLNMSLMVYLVISSLRVIHRISFSDGAGRLLVLAKERRITNASDNRPCCTNHRGLSGTML